MYAVFYFDTPKRMVYAECATEAEAQRDLGADLLAVVADEAAARAYGAMPLFRDVPDDVDPAALASITIWLEQIHHQLHTGELTRIDAYRQLEAGERALREAKRALFPPKIQY